MSEPPIFRLDRGVRERQPHAAGPGELLDAAGYAVGVDVGGTSTKLGLVDPQGQIVVRDVIETGSLSEPRTACEHFHRFALAALDSLDADADSLAVGVAVPGILDLRSGELEYVANLPRWRRFPLRQTLQTIFEGPVAIANDANAAAFAEHSRRQLIDESLALLTLGTGIGCGVVMGGSPYGGDHGCGFEIGHVPVEFGPHARTCGCDCPGHVEAYVGAAGVVRTLRELEAGAGGSSEPLADPVGEITPQQIAAAAEQGHPLALATIDRTADWVGIAASILCQTLDPSFILLGGAMTFGGHASPIGQAFLDRVIATNRRYSLDSVGHRVVIDFATLGNDAGICGISELARQGAPIRSDKARMQARYASM